MLPELQGEYTRESNWGLYSRYMHTHISWINYHLQPRNKTVKRKQRLCPRYVLCVPLLVFFLPTIVSIGIRKSVRRHNSVTRVTHVSLQCTKQRVLSNRNIQIHIYTYIWWYFGKSSWKVQKYKFDYRSIVRCYYLCLRRLLCAFVTIVQYCTVRIQFSKRNTLWIFVLRIVW